MKINNIFKVLFCFMILLSPIVANADDLDDGNADVVDVPAAPIDDYIPLALIAAAGLGYMLMRKKAVNE